MKILLINPPDTRPLDMLKEKVRIGLVAPLGIAYIAAVLEKQHEVKILDCVAAGGESPYNGEMRYGMTDYEIQVEVGKFNPDIVGVSCLFSNKAFDAHNVCRLVKQVNPSIKVVMGGSHVSALPDETLKDPNVDNVALGQGEAWLSEPIKSLDDLPFPARHLLPMEVYLSGESAHSGHKGTPLANITTSRGCPSRCSFCSIRNTFGTAYRFRSPQNVIAEIDHLVSTYHIKELDFEDDNFTANKKRAIAILQGIRDYKLYLNSPSGLAVFALDEELLETMYEAGYYSISLAIESGVPRVLRDLIHKKVDLVKAKRLVQYARSLGLKTKAFFILGYPGETKDDMRRTVEYAANLNLDWAIFFTATALPGTELYKICIENNYLIDPKLDYRYFFYKPNIRTPEFDPDFVSELKEKANEEINFKNNTNLREGKLERARADFSEVLRLYPDLNIAKEALRRISV